MAVNINVPSQVKTYANLAAFPATGALKTIYIAEDTNKTYRWTGSVYVEVSAAGATGITIGTTAITSGTVGRVLFEGTGNVVQESANLFWDNTNGRLGIGTSSPVYPVDIRSTTQGTVLAIRNNGTSGQGNSTSQLYLSNIDGYTSQLTLSNNGINLTTHGGSSVFSVNGYFHVASLFRVVSSTGNVLINTTTDAGYKLDVNGTARIVTSLVVGGAGSGSLTTSVVRCNYLNTSDNGFSVMQLQTLSGNATFFQGVSIGSGVNPVASAQLEVASTTKGFLPPRMTTTQKNAIATPATGLMVYDNVLNRPCFYDGATWITL